MGLWSWIFLIFVLSAIIGFWVLFVYSIIHSVVYNGAPQGGGSQISGRQIGGRQMGRHHLPVHRSAELFNPSPYSGMFTRKFQVPTFYTRSNYTFPLYTTLFIKNRINVGPDMLRDSQITAPWSFPNVHPLRNRRLILV
jgi:hypothetical protein